MIGVGIAGLGFMGRTHMAAYRTVPGVRVVGACARSVPTDLEGMEEVQLWRSVEELIAQPDVDAISITLPTHLHRDAAIAAIDAGKHVLIEKPLGLTVADCEAIESRARASNLVVTTGHVLRYWPGYVEVVRMALSGEIGRPRAAFAERLSSPPRWSDWLASPELSGGAVLDLHIHDLDVLNWLFGIPDAVVATGRHGTTGGWDQVVSNIRYPQADGPALWSTASASTTLPEGYPFSTRLRVECEQGVVEYRQEFDGAQVDADTAAEGIMVFQEGTTRRIPLDGGVDPYRLEIEAFIAAVRSGSSAQRLADATLAVRTALAARLSLETGALAAV